MAKFHALQVRQETDRADRGPLDDLNERPWEEPRWRRLRLSGCARIAPAGTGAMFSLRSRSAVSEIDLREIARAGYADAASTDRKAKAQAVAIFISDQCFGLRRGSVAA
jgi:hypothetical protein